MSKLNSSYMKEVLIKENRDDTGFHERRGKKVNLCTIQKVDATTLSS